MMRMRLCSLVPAYALFGFYAFAQTSFQRTYGGTSYSGANSVQQTTDGGYIIAGSTSSFGSGLSDVYLIKTNSSGDTLWTRTYGGTSDDYGSSVQQTTDGGYIVAGSTTFGDVYLLKANSLGDTLWTRTYGGTIAPTFRASVRQTSDSGYIIAADRYLVKTNSSGDTIWTRILGDTSGFHYGHSIQQTSDGGYIIAGETSPPSKFPKYDLYLVKMDPSGNTLWTRTLGDTTHQFGNSVQQTSDGGYIIAGVTGEQIGGGDMYLVKTNSSGDTLWTRTFLGDPYDAYGHCVQQTSDGGYIIAGVIGNLPTVPTDVYLIKTLVDGTVPVEDERTVAPTSFALQHNYPNPFNPTTGIRYQVSGVSDVKLVVFDLLGREVAVLVNERKAPGSYEVQFDASELASGMYVFRLMAGPFVQSRKMVLVR